jgi:hypothetical protein
MPNNHARHALPPPLDGFLAYWASRLVDGNPPVRNGDFSPEALRQWLGHLALIERQESGDFRFRLAGTNLQRRFNAELTGKNFAEVEENTLGDLKDRVYRAMTLHSPVVKSLWSPDQRQEYFDLILPLANRTGAVDLVIFASYPVKSSETCALN